MAIIHSKTLAIPDGPITSIVMPSDWMANHVQAYTLAGNTAGNSVVSGTNVILQGGNNITLSGTGQTIIISAGSAAPSGGGAIISAGTNSTSTGTVVFSNSNGVSFGMATNGVVTASVVPGAAAGMAAIGAGSQTATSGTMNFANSNGVTFGMSGSNQITASYTVPTVPTQSTQPVAISGSNGSFAYSTLSMGALNGLSFYTSNGSVVGSYTVPTVPGATVFSNSNNVSFGLAGSTVTASASYPAQTAFVFSNANGVSFGTAGSTVTASVAAAGGAQTGISGIVAGTQTQTVGTLSFANSNGISFGLSNSSIITASYTVPTQTVDTNKAGVGFTSTSTAGVAIVGTHGTNGLSLGIPNYLTTAQPVGAYLTTAAQSSVSNVSGVIGGTNATGGTATLSGNVSFSNANGVSFYTSAGNAIVASVKTDYQTAGAYLTTAMVSNAGSNFVAATAGFSGTNISGTIASNGIQLSVAAGGGGADGYNIIGVNGGATQLSTTYQLSNANNISFGLNAGTITASASFAAQTVDTNKAGTGFTSTSIAGAVPTATLNTNGLSFAMPAYLTTAQPVGAYLTTARASNDAIGLNTALTANGVSWTVNSSGLSLNVPAFLTTGANSTHSHGNPTLNLTNINGTTASNSAGLTLSLSAVVPAQTVQPVAVSGSNGSYAFSTLSFGNLNGLSFYTSNGSIVGSYTDGGGGGGSDGVNIIQAGTLGTTGTTFSASTGTMYINGGNNITVSQNGSNQLVISAAQGGIAAGSQTATSGTLVFANSNGVTFGMSGNSQITASVNAGGGGGAPDRFFKEVIQGERLTSIVGFSATNVTNRPLFMPFYMEGTGLAANTARLLMSFGASSNRSCGGTFALGLYSLANSTQMTLLTSDSFSVSSTASASSASWNGVGWVDFGLGGFTCTAEGRYMLAVHVRPVSANVTWMPVSLYGADNMPVQSRVWSNGGTSAMNSQSQFVPFWGGYSTTTNALPDSVGINQINGASSQFQFQYYAALKEI